LQLDRVDTALFGRAEKLFGFGKITLMIMADLGKKRSQTTLPRAVKTDS
jgi:hypothetical protein